MEPQIEKLTERQAAVLDFISHSIDERGYPPTLREIGNHLGIRSTNGVNDHLRALERKGYLTREDMKSRTLRPTEMARSSAPPGVTPIESARKATSQGFGLSAVPPANDMDSMVEIPIVGRVAAGALTEAIEQSQDSVRVDRMLVGSNRDMFGLRISGDSMIEAGIHDGDYVFIRKQLSADRGEIVIALVGDEATCKYYYPERDHIRLQPANSTMAPILLPKQDWRTTQIMGVVVGVYRKLK